MECIAYREAISAKIDGEDDALERLALEGHLAACPSCRAWADTATRVTRAARVRLTEDVPDLTAQIMASIGQAATPPVSRRLSVRERRGRENSSGGAVARVGLLMVATAQLFAALPALLGSDGGAPVDVARQHGAWALALVVAMLAVVARPTLPCCLSLPPWRRARRTS